MICSSANAAPVAYQTAVSSDNPIVYYQLNEATDNATNYGSLGSTHDAGYNGTPGRQTPTFSGDTGVLVNSGDFLQSLGNAPGSVSGNPAFSIEAIMKIPVGGGPGNTVYPSILSWGGTVSLSAASLGFFRQQYEVPFVGFLDGGQITGPGAAAQDQWHHLVWVREAGVAANEGNTLYPIPVPAALWLFVSALGLLARLRRTTT